MGSSGNGVGNSVGGHGGSQIVGALLAAPSFGGRSRWAGLALPIGTFLRRRAQQAAPLRFGCRHDHPRCYPHHSRKSPLSFVTLSLRATNGSVAISPLPLRGCFATLAMTFNSLL